MNQFPKHAPIECNWKKTFMSNTCTGEATEFFQHPDLNQDAENEIWQMALCATCAERMRKLVGVVSITKEEYLTYAVMMT